MEITEGAQIFTSDLVSVRLDGSYHTGEVEGKFLNEPLCKVDDGGPNPVEPRRIGISSAIKQCLSRHLQSQTDATTSQMGILKRKHSNRGAIGYS